MSDKLDIVDELRTFTSDDDSWSHQQEKFLRRRAADTIEQLRGYNEESESQRMLLEMVIKRKDERIATLEGALKKYGQHSVMCDWPRGGDCTCEFDAALAGEKYE